MAALNSILGDNLGLAGDSLVDMGISSNNYNRGTTDVWILSSATPQSRMQYRGVWYDSGIWTDLNLWYD
jgi:hypothetical protein